MVYKNSLISKEDLYTWLEARWNEGFHDSTKRKAIFEVMEAIDQSVFDRPADMSEEGVSEIFALLSDNEATITEMGMLDSKDALALVETCKRLLYFLRIVEADSLNWMTQLSELREELRDASLEAKEERD
jgi:hypothetical protein